MRTRRCGRCGQDGHDRRTCSHSRFVPGIRKCVGEKLVDGDVRHVLECGHDVKAELDSDGMHVREWRECAECKSGKTKTAPT